MTSWFEEEAQRRANQEQPPVQTLEAVKEPVVESEIKKKNSTPRSTPNKSSIAFGAGALGLIGIVVWSGFTLFGPTDTEQPTAAVQDASASIERTVTAPTIQSSESESAPSPQTPSVKQAGSACDTETLDADRATLAGTIVAFESAYYAKDAKELRRTLAKDAPVQSTNWETVLPEVVTDSMTWCVVVNDTDTDTKADVDLTVKDEDSETTYRQTLTGKKAGDSWFIELIENREQ